MSKTSSKPDNDTAVSESELKEKIKKVTVCFEVRGRVPILGFSDNSLAGTAVGCVVAHNQGTSFILTLRKQFLLSMDGDFVKRSRVQLLRSEKQYPIRLVASSPSNPLWLFAADFPFNPSDLLEWLPRDSLEAEESLYNYNPFSKSKMDRFTRGIFIGEQKEGHKRRKQVKGSSEPRGGVLAITRTKERIGSVLASRHGRLAGFVLSDIDRKTCRIITPKGVMQFVNDVARSSGCPVWWLGLAHDEVAKDPLSTGPSAGPQISLNPLSTRPSASAPSAASLTMSSTSAAENPIAAPLTFPTSTSMASSTIFTPSSTTASVTAPQIAPQIASPRGPPKAPTMASALRYETSSAEGGASDVED